MAGFDSRPANYWADCRARTRQALCKANAASRRLVLVSGRLVSLALFIVSATRHLLEMRLCPLRPRSTAQRELVNIFSKAKCLRGPRSEPPLTRRVSPPISLHAALMDDTGRQRKTSQLVVSRMLAAVYSLRELLFVWCLQSGRCWQTILGADT